jgi:V/A-type H+-transporting ATPase subunit I
MSIVEMTKVTLYGLSGEKRMVVRALQEMGCLHVIPLSTPPEEEAAESSGDTGARARDVYEALKYLLRTPQIRRSLRADPSFDIHEVARRALDNKQRQRDVTDRVEFLHGRIANLRRWGHFELPPVDTLGGYRLWFYEVPHRQRDKLGRVTLPWAEVGRSHRTHFVVVLAETEPPESAMPVPRTHTGPKSLRTLERELEDAEIELEDLELERIALTRYIHLIRQNLARADDAEALGRALEEAWDDDGVFAVQGWAPAGRIEEVAAFAEDRGLALVAERPGPGETPPTLLENALPARAGEDLARFYQVPSPRDWDPSGVLLASFSLFFAMILSDAGYGAVVLLATGAFWPRLGRGAVGRRLRVLLVSLGSAAVLYGLAAGSYFGLAPPEGHLLARVNVIEVRDYWDMMALSIGIGVLHVTLANAATAWRHWPEARAFASVGWILVALGGMTAWRGHVAGAATAFEVGLGVLAAGLLGVFLFGGTRPIRRPLDVLWRIGQGLLKASQVTQMFGDVLSYLRLFALGLASASLAITFNDLSAQVLDSVGGVGLLMAILVAVIGHSLNFALAILGGVVHGLRLNFIEFYNWGLTEEGYPYRPLERKELRL